MTDNTNEDIIVKDERFSSGIMPDSILRCQKVESNGQCQGVIVQGSKYCPRHNGSVERNNIREKTRNYRLTKFQARVDDFADNAEAKSLREEIGLIRMLIEEVVNKCENSTDLLLMSNKISDLVMKAEKLVTSCHRLEAATGMLLNKSAVIQLASVLVEIIGSHVKDDNILDSISVKIVAAIANIAVPVDKDGNPLG